jgi:hypothetical protein
MILLPVLLLATSLNIAAPNTLPASHAQHAKATLNRLTAAAEPRLRRKAVAQGLARNRSPIARELAATHVIPDAAPSKAATLRAHRAKTRLDRWVAAAEPRLRRKSLAKALAQSARGLLAMLDREIAASRPRHQARERAVRIAGRGFPPSAQ